MRFTTALVAAFAVGEARYKSGAVTGFEKFTYGKFISRIKAPNKKGTVSSFFTYWNGPNFYPGGWNELDIEIVPSVSQNPLSLNIIYGDGHSKRESHDYDRGFDPKDEWHIYEMAWTPDYISWSLDGKEVRRVGGQDPAVKFMTKGQSVMMNFWTPTFNSWGKGFTDKDMPWYVLYDYVETYTYNNKTKGFDFHWKDDFNTFDSNRWHKSDNTTFDANSTTFRASQSYVLNGNLVLKMEPDRHADRHGDVWDPTHVLPVQTEPTYQHETRGKVQKGDEHQDIGLHPGDAHYEFGNPQSVSYTGEELHHFADRQAPYGGMSYGGFPYGYGGYPQYGRMGYGNPWDHSGYTPYGYNRDAWVPHQDPYAPHVDEPMQHQAAHTAMLMEHEQPKKAAAKDAKKKNTEYDHFGDMYGHHYDGIPMHDAHSTHGHHYANAPIFQDTHFTPAHHPVATHHTDGDLNLHGAWDIPHHDLTPFEHQSHQDPHHASPVHGEDGHDFAHFDAGFWDLKGHEPHLGDQGHFAGEDHGNYHYVDRGVDGHHGTYYSYLDEREHHPAHVSDYHNVHGVEHHPDDWVADVHHPDVYTGPHFSDGREHHDQYFHGDQYDDHHLSQDFKHDTPAHAYHAGDEYGHDTQYHFGTEMVHDIEHSYDELFHDLERQVHHGVEHHDVEYAALHPQQHDVHPHHTDYHYEAPHDFHHETDIEPAHGLPYAHAHGHGHEDIHHLDGHNVHTDMDLHHQASPAAHHVVLDQPAEQKEEKSADKKADVPAGKNLAYHPRGDHYALHHNGSTGAFVQ